MIDLARYIESIVDPTFEDFKRNPELIRHGYLACVATYHAIDRAALPERRSRPARTMAIRVAGFCAG